MKKFITIYATVIVTMTIAVLYRIKHEAKPAPLEIVAYTLKFANDSMHVYEGTDGRWIGSYKWVKGQHDAADFLMDLSDSVNE